MDCSPGTSSPAAAAMTGDDAADAADTAEAQHEAGSATEDLTDDMGATK